MYTYLVTILAIVAVSFFIFLFATALQPVQEAFNPMLEETHWMDTNHFDVFVLAATFVTNLWVFFVVFLIIGLAYWGWTYVQRKNAGGA